MHFSENPPPPVGGNDKHFGLMNKYKAYGGNLTPDKLKTCLGHLLSSKQRHVTLKAIFVDLNGQKFGRG